MTVALQQHPEKDQLMAFGLGKLGPQESEQIAEHLECCDDCSDTIVNLQDDTFVSLVRSAEAPAAAEEKSSTEPPVGARIPDNTHSVGTLDFESGATGEQCESMLPPELREHPRYEVVSLIGKGGMGDVYQARHRMMERTVALKIIKCELMRKPAAVDRFHREVRAAAKLAHPNIVTAHDAEQAGDVHFLVMEHVDGVDLSHLAKEQGTLSVDDACEYVRQTAVGLQHAHEQGMVHRDIKPHNLMLTADGTVKILDFGLASLSPEPAPDGETVEIRGDLTAAGAIMGTPDFISPEQATDARQADIRSDIYSLGATLYFLLSGRPPFATDSVVHKLQNLATAEPEPLESVCDDAPAELSKIVSKMMAKDPADRFQTPAEVAEALAAFANASAVPSLVATQDNLSSTTRTGISKWIALGLVLCLIIGAPVAWFAVQAARQRKAKEAYTQLRQYLKTGTSDEMSLNSLNVLLAYEEGHEYLRKLDRESDKIAFAEGGLPHGLKFAAALLHDDRIEPGQRELSFRTQREGFSGGSTGGLPKQLRVDSVKFQSGGIYERKVVIRYSASSQQQHQKQVEESLKLKPGAEYTLSVALADVIQDRVDWLHVWKEGKPTGVVSNRVQSTKGDLRPNPTIAGAEIKTILVGLDTHKLLTGNYPTAEEGLQVLLKEAKSGKILKQPSKEGFESLLIDPWGYPYAYLVPGKHGNKPDVWSVGPDGKTNTDDDICSWKLPPLEEAQKPTSDLDEIQGTWRITYSEDSGRVAPQEMLKDGRFVFTKQLMTIEIAGRKTELKYKLDSSTNPKSVDFTEKGKTKPGIYDLQGDTLRICFAERTSERPKVFDSQPDSASDVVIMLKRIRPGQETSSSKQLDHSGPLTAEIAKALLPKAASISNEDFKKLATAPFPRPDMIRSHSLSLVLMSLKISEVPGLERDFQYLAGKVPKPSEIAIAMSRSRLKGYVSMIQPEYITDCRVEDASADGRVKGFVSYNAPRLYVGSAGFEAQKHQGKWRIDKFHLQARKISIVLGKDGNWKREEAREFDVPARRDSPQKREVDVPARRNSPQQHKSTAIGQMANLLDSWKKLPDQSEKLREELFKQVKPNTESARQALANLAQLAWPHLLDEVPKTMAQSLADMTKPDASIRISDGLAKIGRPTEPVGWDVQATHALALARAGKIEAALKENVALLKKIEINVRKGRLPDLQLEFFGKMRSQKSLLKQTLLQKSLILAIEGKATEATEASKAASQVEVDKPTKDDQPAVQAMLKAVAKTLKAK